jgi:hypothetical protein
MMTNHYQNGYPHFSDHRQAWEELARGIASLKDSVREVDGGRIVPNSKQGELIILGSGIETIGFSLGDKKLIEEADKVLFCLADPASVVWLKQLRPDALDLYVLYGEDKVRYITYMQMTEAQLYWVRQGLKVVVVFYGHPGIFVLSTHRAVKIARREGYKATMKASVSALDTLCADLGVDPSHPGLQTFEATDCLIRRRRIDPSLHVVLWQVGLIGELGYRRQGYLNNNFSYFINWLADIYNPDFEIVHYIGSRYPTIEPLIQTYPLRELHDPEVQMTINGLSTFYVPPSDVVPTHHQTALDLGVITEGQSLVPPKAPVREIDSYGSREMKAFRAFENFRIPPSYKWQPETEASKFLIALRFDTALQDLYRDDPVQALNDPRFSKLSDRERSLLASRDSGAVQIASKGAYLRSYDTENVLNRLLAEKTLAADVLKRIAHLKKPEAREAFNQWLAENGLAFDWAWLHRSIDFIHRNSLVPFTGVFVEPKQQLLVSLIGNRKDLRKSVLYLNDVCIRRFTFYNGVIKWTSTAHIPFNGFLRPDVDLRGQRRVIGKIWADGEEVPAQANFVAPELDPARKTFSSRTVELHASNDMTGIYGRYAARTTGRFSRQVNEFVLSENGLTVNGKQADQVSFALGTLTWSGGSQACYCGSVKLVIDPIINSIEFFGRSASNEEPGWFQCYGSSVSPEAPAYAGPSVPAWAAPHLVTITYENSSKGGLMFWHKWEKHNFTSMVVNKYIANLI